MGTRHRGGLFKNGKALSIHEKKFQSEQRSKAKRPTDETPPDAATDREQTGEHGETLPEIRQDDNWI